MPRRPNNIIDEFKLDMMEDENDEIMSSDYDGNDYNVERSGETLEETTTRAYKHVLCDLLKLRNYEARRVLRLCPGLLTMRGSRSAEQVVTLLSKMGESTKSIARDR